ncbi:MAG: hypothetical protein ABMA13_20620 [Chthoniobacteraceae bacterium]
MKIDTSNFLRKKRRFDRALAQEAGVACRQLAEDALEQRYTYKGRIDIEGGAYSRIQGLNAVFVPVTLKHQRREMWPNLRPIYDARVRRGQRTYQGREFFWVDENKLAALRQELLARGARKLSAGTWTIDVTQSYHSLRVTIRKRGKFARGDRETVEDIKAHIRAHFAEVATSVLRYALREAGWE